ncbi:MAG: sugar ABC transporter permease [Candidatus Melainabacteria bacterium]|nr:sugar ABC transporter permease [Candidatus Melainabacteria bacterium]
MWRKALAFLSPWLIGLVLFLIGPILASLVLSFTQYDGIGQAQFLGLANYAEMLGDKTLIASLQVTLIFALVSLPLGTVIALTMAILLNQKISGRSFYRACLYLPSVVPIVASSVAWTWIFKGDETGLINQALNLIGLDGPLWLADPHWALPALIIMSFWALGNPMLIYLAGLQNIPQSLYESAEIDGANELEKFWHITLPILSPTMFFNIVIGIIQVFQYFVPAYVMTSGGPQNSTMFYSLYTYQTAFDDFRMGYASALAWLLFLIVVSASALAFYSSKKLVHYS